MKYIAIAIVFVTVLAVWMFRWEYSENKASRVNRITGEYHSICSKPSGGTGYRNRGSSEACE